MRPLVFIDTETVSLKWDAPVWEVGAIRRDASGEETTCHLMVSDVDLSEADQNALAIGRFDERGRPRHQVVTDWDGCPIRVWHVKDSRPFVSECEAARTVEGLTRGAVLVGVNVGFDAERLGHMLRRNKQTPGWYYAPLDLKSMAAGYLSVDDSGLFDAPSRQLSKLCGAVPPTKDEAHTAMGDAKWAKRWYDAMTRGDREPLATFRGRCL